MSSPTPPLALELRPSALADAGLLILVLAAVAAALASNHPLTLTVPLTLLVAALAGQFRQAQRQQGCCRLALHENAEGLLQVHAEFADGRQQESAAAGYAVLGSLAVFVYLERTGWPSWFGPQRLTVLCDATDAASFRQLRARLRFL